MAMDLRDWVYLLNFELEAGITYVALRALLQVKVPVRFLCDHLHIGTSSSSLWFSSEAIFSCSTLLGLLVEIPQHLAEAL